MSGLARRRILRPVSIQDAVLGRVLGEQGPPPRTLEDILMQRAAVAIEPTGANWIPELPIEYGRQHDLYSRMPEPDFVPDTVSDPRLREHFRQQIRQRKAQEAERRQMRSAVWGNQVQGLKPKTNATVLQWMSEDDMPRAVNVQLNYTLDVVTPTNSTDDINVYAKIEWGGGGANHLAFCDWQTGNQLRLTASYVRVSAYYNPINLPTGWPQIPAQWMNPGLPGTGPPLTVSAILGEGHPTFTVSAARFTRSVKSGAGGGATVLTLDPIPQFASALGVLTSAPNPALSLAVSLNHNNFGAETTTANGFTVTTVESPDNQHHIPAASRFLTLVDNTPGGAGGITLLYSINL
jgi:hypothetical protein